MRYWIWWNELPQGPFELDELISLRAFSEELLVCMEDRQDWVPAGRVADLSSAIAQLQERRSQPLGPPPPAPTRPPRADPLQGEFFGETPGQQSLRGSDDEPRGPYAYRRAIDDPDRKSVPLSYLVGQATMPFHFMRQHQSVALIEPAVSQAARIAFSFPRRVTESPVPFEELAPEQEITEEPPVAYSEPAVEQETIEEPPVAFAEPAREEDIVEEPAVENAEPARLPDTAEAPLVPLAESAPEYEITEEPTVRLELLREEPSLAPRMADSYGGDRRLAWLPWVIGMALAFGALAGAGYWLMGRPSAPSTLSEPMHSERPIPLSIPAAGPSATMESVFGAPAGKAPSLPAVSVRARTALASVRGSLRKEIHAVLSLLKKFVFAFMGGPALTGFPVGAPVVGPTGMAAKAASGLLPDQIQRGTPGEPRQVSEPIPASTPIQEKVIMPTIKKRPIPRQRRGRKAVHSLSKKGHAGVKPRMIVETPRASGVSLPGTAAGSPALPSMPVVPALGVPAPPAPRAPDPWAGRQNEAIKLVIAQTLPHSAVTIGSQARTMLEQMHEKELLHAADTGERLYLPDKIAWSALQEESSRYRVYLNFMAWQADGERVQARSYQFVVDLQGKTVRADDAATSQDILSAAAELHYKHDPMATDIESILGGVDTFNKHKVQLMIVRKNRTNQSERKNIDADLEAAQTKVKRAEIYFRRTYAEKALQNTAKAYGFADLLNGK